MTNPAYTKHGMIHCENCKGPVESDEVVAEKVKDDGDVRAYNLECPKCGATGSAVFELGFSTEQEVDDPFMVR